MKSIIKVSAVIGTLGMLAGCAGNSVGQVSAMPDHSGAFNAALHQRYIERAEHEVTEQDLRGTEFFRARAEMAANGKTPVVQNPSERPLQVDVREIDLAYADVSSVLKTTATQRAPDACARSQTWFEQWMEQSEEGNQPDDIAVARFEYEDAITQCHGKVAQVQPQARPMAQASPVAPQPKAMPGTFVIYFDHDSSAMTSEGTEVLDHAVSAGKEVRASRATVIGHTDRSGSRDYNMALSERRAHTVALALRDAGVPTVLSGSSYAGETDPKIETMNGVREEKNRRVVITFVR